MDASLSGTVTGNGPFYRVRLEAAGLAAGDVARLEVDLTRVVFVFERDARCDTRSGGLTCEVSAADTSRVDMILVAPSGATVTATLTPGVDDPDAGNNTWRAVLD